MLPGQSATSLPFSAVRIAGTNGMDPNPKTIVYHTSGLPLFPASDAEETGDISTPIVTDTRKRNSRPKYPYYAENDLNAILRHLAVCLTTAEQTLATFRQMAKGNEDHKLMKGNVAYWSHVVSAIKWMIHKAYQPQKHLTILLDEDILECLTKAMSASKTQ